MIADQLTRVLLDQHAAKLLGFRSRAWRSDGTRASTIAGPNNDLLLIDTGSSLPAAGSDRI
jgi:hypothetical protein